MTSFHFFRPIAACVFSATAATAQDGGQLYATYCAACHADDGKGATGGQFPPLAGSPWVKGTADRMIMTVLHGITGPVEVLGKTYNLEMPPQGAVLADDAIAAIATAGASTTSTGYNPTFTTAGFAFGRGYISTSNAIAQFSNIKIRFIFYFHELLYSFLLKVGG